MINNLMQITSLLQSKEKFKLLLNIVFSFFGIFLEMLALSLIISVFHIIFYNDTFSNFLFFNYLFRLSVELNFNFKFLVVFLFILLFFVKNILLIIFAYNNSKFINFLSIRLSKDLFILYLKQGYQFFLNSDSNYLLRKVTTDINGTKNFLVNLQILFVEITFIFFLSILLIYFNYKIFFFIAFFFSFFVFFYIKIIKKKVLMWSKIFQNNTGNLQNLVISSIKGIKDIFIYNLQSDFIKKFYNLSENAYTSTFKQDFINGILKYWMELLAIFAIFTPMVFFILTERDLDKLLPLFALFVISIFKAMPSINRILGSYQSIKYYAVSYNLILKEFSSLKNDIKIVNEHDIFFKKSIAFKNVTFIYKNSVNPVIDNANFSIKKGSCVAILGKNGTGKSTILNLLSGLLKPNSGVVLFDDIEQKIYNNKNWIKKVSYIQQNIFLLNDSIKNNIVLSEKYIDELKFEEIKKMLLLDEVFNKFNSKLESSVGDDGLFLSGGQKQLISIARALYKNSEIILFDEADSFLDSYHTLNLKNLFVKLKNKVTIIVVTHDNSLLSQSFDQVLKINERSIIEVVR